jgi:diguanylate cyclase (GGDEF)-like protein
MKAENLFDGSHHILNGINKFLSNIRKGEEVQTNEIVEFMEKALPNNNDNNRAIVHSVVNELDGIKNQLEKLKWLNNHYKIIHDFSQECSKTLNEGSLLKKAYELVSQVMPTDSFFIATHDDGDPLIKIILAVEYGEYFPQTTLEFGDNVTSKTIRTREIIHHSHSTGKHTYVLLYGDNPNGSSLFVPVIIDDQVKGVISAQSTHDFAYLKEHEELLHLIGTQIFNSIETVRLYEKIYLMSHTDELTGLKNRRAFHHDLSELIDKDIQPLMLIMIDSDNLKMVNDNYGHDAGDIYLNVIAQGIKSIFNEDIVGYRYAGDEFMIIVKGKMNNNQDQIINALQNFYQNHPVQLSDKLITISASLGIANYPADGTTVSSLKKSVDQALYCAKFNGKNKVVFAKNAQ